MTNPELPCAQPAPDDWRHLTAYGYAPGGYMSRCHKCNATPIDMDKRATTCRPCAEAMYAAALAARPESMRCAGCDLINGCPEFCRCTPAIPAPEGAELAAAARQALESLENSIDLVKNDYHDDWRHGISSRAAQLAGMKAEVEAHEAAITALRAALAAQIATTPPGGSQAAEPGNPRARVVAPSPAEAHGLSDADIDALMPVGEASVSWFDPQLRFGPEQAGKIIDASMAFMAAAPLGQQLFSREQVREVVRAALDSHVQPKGTDEREALKAGSPVVIALGLLLKHVRLSREILLGDLASELCMTSAYLSQLEHGTKPLEPIVIDTIRAWARDLRPIPKLAVAPAPAPAPTGDLIELAAKQVFQTLPGWCGQPWVEGGNSLKQDEARRYARVALAAVPCAAVGAVPPGFVLVNSPITEAMHQAACKVLLRASGLDGTPQRMLDALIAPRPAKKEFDLESFVAAFFRAVDTRGWSAKQVADATGVSETTISRMRNHGRAPDAASLAALADWAGINPAKHMKHADSLVPVQPL